MDKQTRIRIGLVGCGWHGYALAQAIVRSNHLQLVACADPDEVAASRAVALTSDASTHASIEALLGENEVDAIVIATPHHLLASAAKVAIKAGKHVMVEKPLALNDFEASEVEQAVKQASVCYMAGYSFRFSMGRYVRQLLDEGVAGDILAINASISVGSLDEGWIADPETGGGPLLYVGCHLIDWILWFTNAEPSEVFAMLEKRDDTRADYRSVFQLRLTNQVLAQCLVTQGASTFSFQIDIHGTEGKVSLRGRNFLQFEIEVSSKVVEKYHEPTIIRPAMRVDNVEMMLLPELEEFAAAIQEQRPPNITIADGRHVLRVMDAVIESARSNQPIQINN